MKIEDENGRIGEVVESKYHTGGVWAKPEGAAAEHGNINTLTWWTKQADGSYRGLWYDSPRDGFVTAKEAA